MELSADVKKKREDLLAEARFALEQNPGDELAIIWLGRRLAYLGDYRGAIDVYTRGLELHPESYRLRRHRGHRYITLRRFDDAIADLSTAARLADGVPDQIEADGLPNAQNLPRSTTHSNIYYHLGLAHYLRGDFEASRAAYERCLEFSQNDDMRCASQYWLYLNNARLGRPLEASAMLEHVSADMDVIENFDYQHLLLLFKGELTLNELLAASGGSDAIGGATLAYGVAAWYLLEGDVELARMAFQRAVEGAAWPAFGFIAAEAELSR